MIATYTECEQSAEMFHLVPIKAYMFDQHASKIHAELRDSFRALVEFLQMKDFPTQELDQLIQGQYYTAALERAQSYAQCLMSDRQHGAMLVVAASEQLCRHTAVHYRNSCKGFQQLRELQVGEEQMRREQSVHVELGEQCVASQKRLRYIQAWQRNLCCRRATM